VAWRYAASLALRGRLGPVICLPPPSRDEMPRAPACNSAGAREQIFVTLYAVGSLALAGFCQVQFCRYSRAAERTLRSRSSGGSSFNGSTWRSRRSCMAAWAASARSSRDIGRDRRVLAASGAWLLGSHTAPRLSAPWAAAFLRCCRPSSCRGRYMGKSALGLLLKLLPLQLRPRHLIADQQTHNLPVSDQAPEGVHRPRLEDDRLADIEIGVWSVRSQLIA
jgi:hypothetical protein